jgi:fructokinase
VLVTLDEHGSPSYQIEHPSAWDAFDFDARWQDLARRSHAVCFGTLAQRDPRSRTAIQAFVQAAPQAVRLLDVNLRQHFHDARTISESLELATMIKTNEHEAPVISGYVGIDALKSDSASDARVWADALMGRFGLDAVVLTRGPRGTLVCTREGAFESDGQPDSTMKRFPPDPRADSVGAGDACAAGLLVGWLAGLPTREVVAICDRMGAYVAGRPGATPDLPDNLLT